MDITIHIPYFLGYILHVLGVIGVFCAISMVGGGALFIFFCGGDNRKSDHFVYKMIGCGVILFAISDLILQGKVL